MTVETSNSPSFLFNPTPVTVGIGLDAPGPKGELHPRWTPTTSLPLGVVLVSDRKQGEAYAAVDRLVEAARGDRAVTAEPVDVWGSVSLRVADEIENFPRADVEGYVRALVAAAVLRLAEGK